MQSFSELLDKFVTLQIKLYNSLEKTQYAKYSDNMDHMSKEELLALIKEQYSLNAQRSKILDAIDNTLNKLIQESGHKFDTRRYKTDKNG